MKFIVSDSEVGPTMKLVADLHLHSKYSRAVSQNMELPIIAEWAAKKGIDLVGTSDWTHPLWLKELESQLEEVNEGIYKIKNKIENSKNTYKKSKNTEDKKETKFILSTEISSIYSQGGKGRRIHNLVFAPSFTTVHKINNQLASRGYNLMADGRPMIGLPSRDLCELVWSIDEDVLIVSAHAWTPWFSLYGSKSGFDSLDECYGEFANRIYAVETGLSSDPAMNWRIEELDSRSILSFSDAHSPQKLGREATVFKSRKSSTSSKSRKGFSYQNLMEAIKQDKNSDWEIGYTIEFYPEEGKYHYTGHRICGVVQSPEETAKKGKICPVCGRSLTIGVMHRVQQLAKRELKTIKRENKAGLVGIYNLEDEKRPPYVMLVPLLEILSEALNAGVSSQNVVNEYSSLIKKFGTELAVLTQAKPEEITSFVGQRTAEAIIKVRKGDIFVNPGFDGLFGVVKIWGEKEAEETPQQQMSLF